MSENEIINKVKDFWNETSDSEWYRSLIKMAGSGEE